MNTYKINPKSITYKLVSGFAPSDLSRRLHNGGNVSLCEYFWTSALIWTSVIIFCTITIGSAVGYLYSLISLLIFLTFGSLGIFFEFMNVGSIKTAAGITGILTFVYAISLAGEGQICPEYLKRWWSKVSYKKKVPKPSTPEKVAKKPSLLSVYYKAYKDKFCPLVELDKEK